MPDRDEQAEDFANRDSPMQSPIYNMPSQMMQLLLDNTLTIQKIKHNLMGEILVTKYVKDEASGEVVPVNEWAPEGERVMNDKGIRAVINELDTYISTEFMFTTLKEQEIYRIILSLDKNLNDLFYTRGKEFELSNNMKGVVKDAIVDRCFAALNKSKDGFLVNSLTKVWSVKELKGFGSEKKGSTWDALLSPLKGGGNKE